MTSFLSAHCLGDSLQIIVRIYEHTLEYLSLKALLFIKNPFKVSTRNCPLGFGAEGKVIWDRVTSSFAPCFPFLLMHLQGIQAFIEGHCNRLQILRNAALRKWRTGQLSFDANRVESYLGSWSFGRKTKSSWELSQVAKCREGRDLKNQI